MRNRIMSTVLEIINGIAQAAANVYDGAHDENGEPINVGLKREEGHPIHDKRVMDGFSVKFQGPHLCICYHSEVNLKDVQGDKLEKEIEQMIAKVATFLKKEYKRITGNALTLTKDGDVEARMEYMNRIRCWVTAKCKYKIGGMDSEARRQPSEDRLEKNFKDFLALSDDKRPQNDKRKKESDPTFTPWNMLNK